jgi:hypothetical protein
MRCWLCALLLCLSAAAEVQSPSSPASSAGSGSFYVNGIVYRYAVVNDYTVVAAAHSVLNHKFVAVKVRVYNLGQQSVTVKPEDVTAEDALANRALATISGPELARRMRRPYNWARFAVVPVAGGPEDNSATDQQVTPQLLEMMRAMAAKMNSAQAPVFSGKSVLFTDTPGALQGHPGIPSPAECGTVCRLRNREAASPDVLAQLQRQTTPEFVEQNSFLANTITPQSDADGVLFLPMPKLEHGVPLARNGQKAGLVRVTVPVGEEKFQFVLMVD